MTLQAKLLGAALVSYLLAELVRWYAERRAGERRCTCSAGRHAYACSCYEPRRSR